jgi:hypothetical protein
MIYQRKIETGELSFGFIFGVFIMMLCLLISRIFFLIFDFVLTNFDPSTYSISPNYYFWKTAVLILSFGYAFVLFIIDRDILEFKFKGILSAVMLIVALIITFYPINTKADFELISSLLFIINIMAIALPLLFFYIGLREVSYRKPAFLISAGVIIYALGSNILIESVVAFIESIIAGSRVFIYFLSLILKISGIITYSYGVTHFTLIFSK